MDQFINELIKPHIKNISSRSVLYSLVSTCPETGGGTPPFVFGTQTRVPTIIPKRCGYTQFAHPSPTFLRKAHKQTKTKKLKKKPTFSSKINVTLTYFSSTSPLHRFNSALIHQFISHPLLWIHLGSLYRQMSLVSTIPFLFITLTPSKQRVPPFSFKDCPFLSPSSSRVVCKEEKSLMKKVFFDYFVYYLLL